MIRVDTTATTSWEIDEEKIFVLYEDEWNEFKEECGGRLDEIDREDFIKEVLWEIVPHFQEVGGVEVYDDYEIDVRM